MIKNWQIFNESNSSDSFKQEVIRIRQYFLEYEDDNIVSYEMYVCGQKENEMLWSINPNTGNFDRWIESQTEEAERYLDNKSYQQLFLKSDLDKYPFIFVATIKIPGLYSMIKDDGVEKLEDVIVTWKRLKDEYDKVVIDMNSNSQEYKPVSLKVYFNPIVD